MYFFDTKDLACYGYNLVLRARAIAGEDDDSTVKVRPVVLANDAARWRTIDAHAVELDVVGERQVPSAKVDREEIKSAEKQLGSLKTLFSKEQKALFEAYADGIKLNSLRTLGPVKAKKWELDKLDGFPYELCIEEWNLEDEMRFYELSIKVPRKQAKQAHAAFRALLERLGLNTEGEQTAKTPVVLDFFAKRL